jgi:hypothetical protein
MITADTKLDLYRGQLRAMDRSTPLARRAFVATGAAVVMQRAVQLSNTRARDTGRYVRAQQEAYNQIVSTVPEASALVGGMIRVTTIGPSSFVKNVFPRLKTKLAKFMEIERTLLAELRSEEAALRPNKGRIGWVKRRLDKVGDVTDRIISQLEAIDKSGEAYKYAIVIGARKTKGLFTLSRIDTVHLPVYGGSARFVGDAVLEVRNREPHARIVARRTGIERDAMAALRGSGVQKAGRAYLMKLQAASGVKLLA